MTELKACPFCGNMAGRSFQPTFGDYYGCPNHTTMMMTVEQWNTRPIEDELQRKLEESEESNNLTVIALKESDKQIENLQAKLDIAVEALVILSVTATWDWTHTKIALEALKKLEA